jgi:hypothetical protein
MNKHVAHPDIRVIINGREVPRTQVLAWEKKRALAVLRKLGVKPAGAELSVLQQQLLERKAALGPEGIRHLLRRELALSDRVAGLMACLSGGARRFCVIELVADQGSAEQFVAWFEDTARRNDDAALLGATPDHYLLHTDSSDTMEVIETNGGSPLAARFFIRTGDVANLRSSVDPTFPVRFAGVARSARGVAIGGVRHQFRNEGGGFRARLTIEFPWLMLPQVMSGHQWHLASEFGNWIDMALASA